MAKVTYNGVVLAESDAPKVVEGNLYFPPSAVNMAYFKDSSLHTTCAWKGQASYYTIEVGETRLENAAWYYPQPSSAAAEIKDHVAFYGNKVQIER